MNKSFIICEQLVKIYKVAELEVVALQGLDLTVQSGKLLGSLDRPSAGKVEVTAVIHFIG